jgi:hypothetical protein
MRQSSKVDRMLRHNLIVITVSFVGMTCLIVGRASADDWHGSGWLGSSWGRWGNGFRRDPIVGFYGRSAFDPDPYASYRNDNGCYRVLPVATPSGVQLRRLFVCNF